MKISRMSIGARMPGCRLAARRGASCAVRAAVLALAAAAHRRPRAGRLRARLRRPVQAPAGDPAVPRRKWRWRWSATSRCRSTWCRTSSRSRASSTTRSSSRWCCAASCGRRPDSCAATGRARGVAAVCCAVGRAYREGRAAAAGYRVLRRGRQFFADLASVRGRARDRAAFTAYLACAPARRSTSCARYPTETFRYRDIWAAYFAGYGFNSVIPARGGDVIRLFLTKTSVPRSSYPAVGASFAVENVFDLTMAVFILGFAFTPGRVPQAAGLRGPGRVRPVLLRPAPEVRAVR